MNQNFDPLLYELGRDALFGLSVMALVLVFNGVCYTRVLFWYRKVASNVSSKNSLGTIVLFVMSVLALAIVQLCAILIWALALFHMDLIPTRAMAILFSGSCYTTIGVFEDLLPAGWKSVALFIAFSGLFSFAWATSIMMSMANSFTQAWDKSNKPRT
ncbi:MAG: hypothetical protein RL651_1279 [Pseudomonadota bacterium]|jgi:hypothetical protein